MRQSNLQKQASEAEKNQDIIALIAKNEIEAQLQPYVKSKKMTVTTEYNPSTHLVGVSEAIEGTEIFLPTISTLSELELTVGVSVWVYCPYTSLSNAIVVSTCSGKVGGRASVLQFDTDYEATGSEPLGSMYWNPDEGTTDLILPNGVTLQAGQEITVQCKNQSGATITDGTPVMYNGALGASGRIKVVPAIADGSILAGYYLGISTQEILNGEDGYITTFGKVRKIDTTGTPYSETWANGDILYVGLTAGSLTNVRPTYPNYIIPVGVVVYAHANGDLFAKTDIRMTAGTDYISPAFIGIASGIASLDANTKVTPSQTSSHINTQADSYTLVLTDAGKLIKITKATAANVTIPLFSSVAFPVGTEIEIVQYGAGTVTIVAISGVTLYSADSAVEIAAQYGSAALKCIAQDEWLLTGYLA